MQPMPLHRNSKPDSGFTLVELLVAMAAIALISAFTWRGVDAISETADRARSRSESLLSISRAIERLRDDLDALECSSGSSAAADKGDPESGAFASRSAGDPDEPTMLGAIEFGSALPATFALWTRRLDPPEPNGLQVVAWFSEPQDTGSALLVRWASAPLSSTEAWSAAIESARNLRSDPSLIAKDGSSVQRFDAATSIRFEKSLSQGLWKAGALSLACPARVPISSFQDLALKASLSPSASFDMGGAVHFVWASPLITGAKP